MRSCACSAGRAASSPRVPVPASVLNRLRSSPAENTRPAPRTTTTRTSSSRVPATSRSAVQVSGVCALSWSARSRVTVRTAPSRSARTRPSELVYVTRPVYSSVLLAVPVGPAAAAQRRAGLRQQPVHEAVGAVGRGGQGADGLPAVVALAQVVRERRPVTARDPLALAEVRRARVGHDSPPGRRCPVPAPAADRWGQLVLGAVALLTTASAAMITDAW